MTILISNLTYASSDNTIINMDVSGWFAGVISFTYHPNDTQPLSVAVAATMTSTYTIAPYVAPPPFCRDISKRQFYQQLAVQGTITSSEAIAVITSGAMPSMLVNAIATLPTSEQFNANMLLLGAVTFQRTHPMTAVLASLMGWTSSQVDSLWSSAYNL